jgi:hypothetical protein
MSYSGANAWKPIIVAKVLSNVPSALLGDGAPLTISNGSNEEDLLLDPDLNQEYQKAINLRSPSHRFK